MKRLATGLAGVLLGFSSAAFAQTTIENVEIKPIERSDPFNSLDVKIPTWEEAIAHPDIDVYLTSPDGLRRIYADELEKVDKSKLVMKRRTVLRMEDYPATTEAEFIQPLLEKPPLFQDKDETQITPLVDEDEARVTPLGEAPDAEIHK